MKSENARQRSIRGSSIFEASAFMMLVSLSALGFGSTDRPERDPALDAMHQSQAVAIAEGQMAYVNDVPFDQLVPNGQFERAPWIHQPDYDLGQIPVSIQTNGVELESEQIYTVSWRVANAHDGELLRDVSVRIQWVDTGETTRSYTLHNTRW